MEPQAPKLPEVMPVAPEQGVPSSSTPESSPVAAPEVQTGSVEKANQGTSVQLPPVTIAAPAPQPAAEPAAPPPTTSQGVVVTSPPVADDVDIIEKEWVDKAKKIVEKTKDDPHRQTAEVSILRADYLKKRYGKEVKLSEY